MMRFQGYRHKFNSLTYDINISGLHTKMRLIRLRFTYVNISGIDTKTRFQGYKHKVEIYL